MKKLLITLALAALVPANALASGDHLGTALKTVPLQLYRLGSALGDTCTIKDNLDSLRTGMIDVSDADWSSYINSAGGHPSKSMFRVTVVLGNGGAAIAPTADTLWANMEPTLDGGRTYVPNSTLGTTTYGIQLFRESANGNLLVPGSVYYGYFFADDDIAAAATPSSMYPLFVKQFRLMIYGNVGGYATGARTYLTYPVARALAGPGVTELGDQIMQKQLFFSEAVGTTDTTFVQDENDSIRTLGVDVSDIDWPMTGGMASTLAKATVAKVTLLANQTNAAADTVYGYVEMSYDNGRTWSTEAGFSNPVALGNMAVPCVRVTPITGLTSPVCYVGMLQFDPDAASPAAASGFFGPPMIRLKFSGDIGGTTPVVQGMKAFLAYPTRRVGW